MTPKIGDKFKLCHWTWEVTKINDNKFSCSIVDEMGDLRTIGFLALDLELADSLDWIEEPATISQEARDEIIRMLTSYYDLKPYDALVSRIDSMVAKNV